MLYNKLFGENLADYLKDQQYIKILMDHKKMLMMKTELIDMNSFLNNSTSIPNLYSVLQGIAYQVVGSKADGAEIIRKAVVEGKNLKARELLDKILLELEDVKHENDLFDNARIYDIKNSIHFLKANMGDKKSLKHIMLINSRNNKDKQLANENAKILYKMINNKDDKQLKHQEDTEDFLSIAIGLFVKSIMEDDIAQECYIPAIIHKNYKGGLPETKGLYGYIVDEFSFKGIAELTDFKSIHDDNIRKIIEPNLQLMINRYKNPEYYFKFLNDNEKLFKNFKSIKLTNAMYHESLFNSDFYKIGLYSYMIMELERLNPSISITDNGLLSLWNSGDTRLADKLDSFFTSNSYSDEINVKYFVEQEPVAIDEPEIDDDDIEDIEEKIIAELHKQDEEGKKTVSFRISAISESDLNDLPKHKQKQFNKLTEEIDFLKVDVKQIEKARRKINQIYPWFQQSTNQIVNSILYNHDKGSEIVKFDPVLVHSGPGMGKTTWAKMITKEMGLDTHFFSLSGVYNSMDIVGTSKGFANKTPSIVSEFYSKQQHGNGVILFDEVDKTGGDRDTHGNVYDALIALTEQENSKHFKDIAIGANIDASHINYIFTANDIKKIPTPLKSRLKVIKADPLFISNPNSPDKDCDLKRITYGFYVKEMETQGIKLEEVERLNPEYYSIFHKIVFNEAEKKKQGNGELISIRDIKRIFATTLNYQKNEQLKEKADEQIEDIDYDYALGLKTLH